MRRALVVALVILGFGLFACAKPKPPRSPAAPLGELPPIAFEADETIDVATDWRAGDADSDPPDVVLSSERQPKLELRHVDARGVIYGPLAFTELHLSFAAGRSEDVEGDFAITLPPGASVSRFAVRVGSLWQEGEIAELSKARAAFESAVRRKPVASPPALLEKTIANRFRARVFPIRGDGPTEIVVAYAEALTGPYRVLLREMPKLDRLDVQVLVPAKRKAYVRHRSREEPRNDFALWNIDDTSVARAGSFTVTRVPAEEPPVRENTGDLAVLIDTSASRAGPDYAKELDQVAKELASFGGTLHVAAFDQEVVPVKSVADVKARRPGGATNFEAALLWGAQHAKRILVVTDGRSMLPNAQNVLARVDVRAVGRPDIDGLRALVGRGDAAGAIFTESAERGARLEFSDGEHTWPHRVGLRSKPPESTVVAPAALVERAVVEARIRELDRTKDRAEIIALSQKHHLLTPLTAMLIVPGAPAAGDILTVTSRGVVTVPRGAAPTFPPRPFDPIPSRSTTHDTDQDGIVDAFDECPLEPETFNGWEDADGCPDRAEVHIDEDVIVVIRTPRFERGSAAITPEAASILDDDANTLLHHHDFTVIGLTGHATPDEPPDLARKRVVAVRDALVKRGLPARMFVMKSYGSSAPDDPEASASRNRRVELKVLATPDGETGVEPRDLYTLPMPTMVRGGKPIMHGSPHGRELEQVMTRLTTTPADARRQAETWLDREPFDPLAWLALGMVLDTAGDRRGATRAYGSMLDLAETSEDLRGAGHFLASVGAYGLAYAAYERALHDRPEQLGPYRDVAWMRARLGQPEAGLAFMMQAHERKLDATPARREVVGRDIALLGAMTAAAAEPARRAITLGAKTDVAVLDWESNGSDLDLVAVGAPSLADEFRAPLVDVTEGLGPELVVLDDQHPMLEVHEIVRGPNRYTIGKVTVFHHDGRGHVTWAEEPFVMNTDGSRFVVPARTSAPPTR